MFHVRGVIDKSHISKRAVNLLRWSSDLYVQILGYALEEQYWCVQQRMVSNYLYRTWSPHLSKQVLIVLRLTHLRLYASGNIALCSRTCVCSLDRQWIVCKISLVMPIAVWFSMRLFGHVMSSLAELITSQTSLSGLDLDELSNMLNVVDRVKGQLLSSIICGIHLDQTQITSKRSTNTLSVLSVWDSTLVSIKYLYICLNPQLDAWIYSVGSLYLLFSSK
jgi:hypothetical protein